jgi:hypothetical protein
MTCRFLNQDPQSFAFNKRCDNPAWPDSFYCAVHVEENEIVIEYIKEEKTYTDIYRQFNTLMIENIIANGMDKEKSINKLFDFLLQYPAILKKDEDVTFAIHQKYLELKEMGWSNWHKYKSLFKPKKIYSIIFSKKIQIFLKQAEETQGKISKIKLMTELFTYINNNGKRSIYTNAKYARTVHGRLVVFEPNWEDAKPFRDQIFPRALAHLDPKVVEQSDLT